MDPFLKELCLEILNENVNSERFAWLLIETGIKVESFEWDVINKLLNEGDELKASEKTYRLGKRLN